MTELELKARQLAEEHRANLEQEDIKRDQNRMTQLQTKLKSREVAVGERKQQLAEDVEAGSTTRSAAELALTKEKTKSEQTGQILDYMKSVESGTKALKNTAEAVGSGIKAYTGIKSLKRPAGTQLSFFS